MFARSAANDGKLECRNSVFGKRIIEFDLILAMHRPITMESLSDVSGLTNVTFSCFYVCDAINVSIHKNNSCCFYSLVSLISTLGFSLSILNVAPVVVK